MLDRPARPEVSESVWDRLASTYALAGPDHFSAFARRLIEVVPIDPDAVVLDLACGAGALVSAVMSAGPPMRLVAVDRSVAMLRRCQQVTRHGGRYGVAAMDACLLALADRTFSTVMCESALDSFPDPVRALSEVHRVLRPGGNL